MHKVTCSRIAHGVTAELADPRVLSGVIDGTCPICPGSRLQRVMHGPVGFEEPMGFCGCCESYWTASAAPDRTVVSLSQGRHTVDEDGEVGPHRPPGEHGRELIDL